MEPPPRTSAVAHDMPATTRRLLYASLGGLLGAAIGAALTATAGWAISVGSVLGLVAGAVAFHLTERRGPSPRQ